MATPFTPPRLKDLSDYKRAPNSTKFDDWWDLLNAEQPTQLFTVTDYRADFSSNHIPNRDNDHVFLWAGTPDSIRPTTPGLHILPIGNRLEIFRAQPRAWDFGSDIHMKRDRRGVPGGPSNVQNTQLTVESWVDSSDSSEWGITVVQDIRGVGIGQHAGVSAYADRRGSGQGAWNFIGGVSDHTPNPQGNGVCGAELAIRAAGGDANSLRTFLDLIGSGIASESGEQIYNAEIGSGIRIHTVGDNNGFPNRTRIRRPININCLWGVDDGAFDVRSQERVGIPVGSAMNYLKANNQDDTFRIRSRRFKEAASGEDFRSLSLDFVREAPGAGEYTVLSLMPDNRVQMGNLDIFGEILAQGKVRAGSLEIHNLPVANDNASATNVYQNQVYRTPDGTLKVKF